MKKINLKNIIVVGLIVATSTLASADSSNTRSFVAGVVTGAVLDNVFTKDKYSDRPVYVYQDKYYYGGDYRNGYYYHNGVKLYGGKYYNQPRYNNYRNQIVLINDRYNNEPVYIYHGRYYYGGIYKHGRYYFQGYRLSGGQYYYQPRTYYKHKVGYNYQNYRNNDRINTYNQDTRSYNYDRRDRNY
ncbi:MAG: hypothetical protein PHI02_06910 [Sulfurovaceae bacterium]|nr:hypothetical protein [Sulfurovaceae bacterium]